MSYKKHLTEVKNELSFLKVFIAINLALTAALLFRGW